MTSVVAFHRAYKRLLPYAVTMTYYPLAIFLAWFMSTLPADRSRIACLLTKWATPESLKVEALGGDVTHQFNRYQQLAAVLVLLLANTTAGAQRLLETDDIETRRSTPATPGAQALTTPEESPAGIPLLAQADPPVARPAQTQAPALTVSESVVPDAGSTFRDTLVSGGEGPEMVVIPAGSFHMGCVSEQNCEGDELPVYEVVIAQSFAMSKFEVTFEDYDRFAHFNDVNDEGWGRGRQPVVNVSWDDATAYVAWLSEQTGKRYRLPSEAEWEYVARAGSTTQYSWGDDIGRNRANCVGCRDQWDNTAPVGSFSANAWGLHDMHGNVWEWVQDCYSNSYAGVPTDGSASISENCSQRVLRGGSWATIPDNTRSAYRSRNSPTFRYDGFGFRLVRDL